MGFYLRIILKLSFIEFNDGIHLSLRDIQTPQSLELLKKVNYKGAYIIVSENIDWSIYKEEICENMDLANEFKEKCWSCNCSEKFDNVADKKVILIGKANNFKKRLSYFIASIIDNHAEVFQELDIKLPKTI